MNYLALYNPLSANKNGEENAKKLEKLMPNDTFEFSDITKVTDYSEIFASLGDKKLVICGGDGTLNKFVNLTSSLTLPEHIYYYPCGTGNDFATDIGASCEEICEITAYLRDLPSVTVNGKDYKFINGIGFGIDGYCCEVGDAEREKSDKPVNYTAIAIKGLLFYFKPKNATVTVDGTTKEYKKVWLAPTMNGRCYGGGMIPTPDQARLDPEHKLSVLVWHGSGKIPTLANFPSIFKGEHLKKSKMCEVLTGHNVTVKFDAPCALQIDGETILGVTEYTCHSVK